MTGTRQSGVDAENVDLRDPHNHLGGCLDVPYMTMPAPNRSRLPTHENIWSRLSGSVVIPSERWRARLLQGVGLLGCEEAILDTE